MSSTIEESSASSKDKKNNDYPKIDKLLSEIFKKEKTIDIHILKYFKKNDYNSITKKNILSTFTKEFSSNPDKFLNSNKNNFDSKNNFTYCLNKALTKDLFIIYNQNKVKYIKVNPEKTLEYLTSLKKQILLENGRNTVIKKKKVNLDEEDNSNKNPFLNKKRKRQKLDKEKNKYEKEIKEQNKSNNKKEKKQKESPKKESEENPTSEKIYNNFSFHQSHLSKLTFNDKILSNNSAPFSNNSFFFNSEIEENEIPLSPKDLKEELLYMSKDEEEAFKIISKEIKPLEQKLNEINSFITYKQKKLEIISNLLVEMNDNLEKYKEVKTKFNDDYNEIKICFKAIENHFKIFKIAENTQNVPYKNDIYKTHIKFIKNILKKSKGLCESNEKIANKLNNYDIAFTSAKIAIESDLREIIEGDYENKDDNDLVENLKNILRPNFDEAFKKLNYFENNIDNTGKEDNYNDMKNIYEKNTKVKSDLAIYVEKVKSFENKK